MKRLLLSFLALTTGFLNAQVDEYGYTQVDLSMGASYANRVFFDLSQNNQLSQDANNWDVAFYRVSAYNMGTRINDAKNILVYEASNVPADWDNINIADLNSWGDPLYNPDTTENLSDGAFQQGSATYGWGEYNIVTHQVTGTIVFVLHYVSADQYVKFMINSYSNGYNVKYAKWNGSSWDATQQQTIANGDNNRYFNYLSFDSNSVVPNNEPEIGSWDLMFTRYWTFYGGQMMYRMSGVIQAPELAVAKVEETQATNSVSNPTEYSEVITAIGHSWKPTSGVYDNVVYYIKEGNDIYRLYFVENGGASTGNMYFKYKNVTGEMGLQDLNADLTFGVYPNPTLNKKVTLVYESKKASNSPVKVSVYNMAGQKVHETSIQANAGFYQKELNLSQLNAGVYVLTLDNGKEKSTKKLIIK